MKARIPAAVLALLVLGCGGEKAARKPRRVKAAGPVRGPLLWKITAKSGKVSHLLALPPHGVVLDELPPIVWRALERSTTVAVKWDPAKSSHRPPAVLDLEAELGEADWKRLVAALAGVADPDKVRKVPLEVAVALATMFWLINDPDPEYELIERVRKKKLPLVVLDPDFDRGLVDNTYGPRYARGVIANLAAKRDEVERKIHAYRVGDAEALGKMASGAFREVDRPERLVRWYREIGAEWFDRARPALAAGGLFIALDYDEVLRHQDGMLPSLIRRGYRVERLGVGTPATLREKARPQSRLADCRGAMRNVVWLAVVEQNPKATPAERAAGLKRVVDASGMAIVNACMKAAPDYASCLNQSKTLAQIEACDAAMLSRHTADTAPAGAKKTEIELEADRMCACKDASCARAALDRMIALDKRFKAAKETFTDRDRNASYRFAACAVRAGMSRDELLQRLREAKPAGKERD